MNEIKNSINYWNKIHENYNKEDIKMDNWLDKFNTIIDNVQTPILDLGCGSGNDTLYLLNKNKKVISCDLSSNAIENIKKNFPDIMSALCFNMLDDFPFSNNYFGLVIADLSLHYFKENDTKKILNEIKRIITTNGYLIIRVNSINDTNHGAGQGKEIEKHLYETKDERLKRFFDEEDIRYFFKDFNIEYLKEEIMTRYGLDKKLFEVCLKNKKEK